MRVEVLAEDIEKGKPGNTKCCAVARALSRATGEEWEVDAQYAGRQHAKYSDSFDLEWFPLPLDVQDFVAQFDLLSAAKRKKLEPFAFEMEL